MQLGKLIITVLPGAISLFCSVPSSAFKDDRGIIEKAAKVQTFRGIYYQSFEVSHFTPCGQNDLFNESWWVMLPDDVSKRLLKMNNPRKTLWGQYFYFEIEGATSNKSDTKYGHLGRYSRQLDIISVTKAEIATEGMIEKCTGSAGNE